MQQPLGEPGLDGEEGMVAELFADPPQSLAQQFDDGSTQQRVPLDAVKHLLARQGHDGAFRPADGCRCPAATVQHPDFANEARRELQVGDKFVAFG